MRNILLSTVLAASIALGGATAASAQSQNDVAKALAGIAGIYVLGKVIEEANDNKKEQAADKHVPRWSKDDDRRDDRWDPPGRRAHPDVCVLERSHNGRWEKRDRRCDVRTVERPRICLRQRWTPNGWVTYYDNDCLDRHRGSYWRQSDRD